MQQTLILNDDYHYGDDYNDDKVDNEKDDENNKDFKNDKDNNDEIKIFFFQKFQVSMIFRITSSSRFE